MISDTVVVASITLASGLIGALFGYLGVKYSTKKQLERDAQAAYFNARLQAYEAFYAAYVDYLRSPSDELRYTEFCSALDRARLVASSETTELLTSFSLELASVEKGNPPPLGFKTMHKELLDAMQMDLRAPLLRDKQGHKDRKRDPERKICKDGQR